MLRRALAEIPLRAIFPPPSAGRHGAGEVRGYRAEARSQTVSVVIHRSTCCFREVFPLCFVAFASVAAGVSPGVAEHRFQKIVFQRKYQL